MNIDSLNSVRLFFESGMTKTLTFRKEQLHKLKAALLKHEKELHAALYEDLKKSPEESWVTETGFLLSEINFALKNLREWMQPEKVCTTLVNFPSTSVVNREPLGVVLIIGPWNYPFQLLFTPLVGAIAAGNCMVVKASEYAPSTSAIMRKMIEQNFPKDYIFYVEGDGARIVPDMMNHFRFDHVFYTGGSAVGKSIYKMAAEKLVPVTLELGGKSPCVVEDDANIRVAAKRIAVTKFSNAGQMCVAPDYVLAHTVIKENLISALTEIIPKFFGNEPIHSHNYGKMINEKQFDRVLGYLNCGKVVHGGRYDRNRLYIEPTILEDVSLESAIMNEEIFGPILPIITFSKMEEAKSIIKANPDPLSFYIFTSSNEKANSWLEATRFGGACVNNASWHLTNYHLPFGGLGSSGTGNYHGRYSFETFTHRKGIMRTPTWFDPAIKYPPYAGKMEMFKSVIK